MNFWIENEKQFGFNGFFMVNTKNSFFFRALQFPRCDGRCVQSPGTYSPWRADPRLLVIPSSCSRVAENNPYWDDVWGVAPTFILASFCHRHCGTCVAQSIRAMRTWRDPPLPPIYHWQSHSFKLISSVWQSFRLDFLCKGLRSFEDLTWHLTARTVDSHAAPVKGILFLLWESSLLCQGLVRFCALYRIKPHAPPLVRAPVNSFEFRSCGCTPQAVGLLRLLKNVLHSIIFWMMNHTGVLSQHRLRHGLLGYLILFAPHAFAPQRQLWTRYMPSHLVFLRISTNFTSPLEILVSSFKLKFSCSKGFSTGKLWIFTLCRENSLRALYAQLFWITLAPSVLPRLLAQNWPGLLPWVTSSSILNERGLRPKEPSSLTQNSWIKLALIVQDSLLLPPERVWAVSQSHCGWSFFQTS